MILVASGSGERQFPGPAVLAAHKMGMAGTPAVDLPMASAGSLFGLSLAAELAAVTGPVLVIGAEKMSRLVGYEPREKGVAVLFGDGAGAALVAAEGHGLEIRRCTLGSDGSFTEDLYAEQGAPLRMNGRSVILQASRKIPAAIRSVLEKDGVAPQHVAQFIMHQANQNLLDKVAETLGVAADRFYTNIRRYGNTSSASMLIAAAEWWEKQPPLDSGAPVVLAAFGAGFHWGAILCRRSI
jgi:3-oxoacyl-[acyl-carrier-protein] synthase-3